MHWSVFLIAGIILLNAIRRPVIALVGLASYLGVLLIHECGHLIAAQRKGYFVDSIELYPIFGICYFQSPWSLLDQCAIAWGGVLAQAVIAVPIIAWVISFGYTRFEAVNALLAIMGFFSLGVAAFNLIPRAPLDGAIAWKLFPALIQRARERKKKRANKHTTDWRTY